MTKLTHSLGVAAFLAALSLSPPASAEFCGAYGEVAALLTQTYKEQRMSRGVTLNGQLLEIYVAETGSWTVVMASPQGRACVISAGEGWEGQDAAAVGAGA